MKLTDPLRPTVPPADATTTTRPGRARRPATTPADGAGSARPASVPAVGAALALAAVSALALAGCGRSAPVDALGAGPGGDPSIAGVSVTSPDAVVDTTAPPATESTAPATTAPPQQLLYTVQPGDTLSGIAATYDVSVDDLAAYNGIGDVNDLSPGQELAIPPKPAAEGPTTPPPTEAAPATP